VRAAWREDPTCAIEEVQSGEEEERA